ncbi:hypothetical protein [Kocuria sp. SM24M-10]|uniref:hypothetical protein n=1 Tax=Kocuria sp. SM24M-10 TaxID=1660349 RepID=UPI000649C40B|nr:hypothetical protein [Kocuria sp. SM24M-10]KLU10625.1 hypothetical protein ABL57_05640 [Kocuria sp. SM24M-10]
MYPVPDCPQCFGPWLNGWRWQHQATDCFYRAREDATQAADADRLRQLGRAFTRPATAAEADLWLACTGQQLPRQAMTTVHADIAGAWMRQIGNYISAQQAVRDHPIPTPTFEEN